MMSRRAMMEAISMVGQLSRYERKDMTFPTAQNDNNYRVIPVSFQPKIMIFSGGTDQSGNIISGIYMFDENEEQNCGGTKYRNSANGNIVTSGVVTGIKTTQPASGANVCSYYDGSVYISRVSGNGYWSSSDTYTFEFYA